MSTWKQLPVVLGIITLAAIVFGCQDDPLSPIWDHPHIEGEIIGMGTHIGKHERLAMLVEEEERQAIFYLTEDTEVFGIDSSRVSIDDLETGLSVRVWPRGFVLTSNPARGDAGRVEVLSTQ